MQQVHVFRASLALHASHFLNPNPLFCRSFRQIQNILRTQLSSAIATRKKLTSDLEHSQAATVALREQVGASASLYTESLQAAAHRQATLQKDFDIAKEKLEDAGVAFETLSELAQEGGAEEESLRRDLEELKQVQYDHTKWFCQKELPILQAIHEKQGQLESSRSPAKLDLYTHSEHLRSEEGSDPNFY